MVELPFGMSCIARIERMWDDAGRLREAMQVSPRGAVVVPEAGGQTMTRAVAIRRARRRSEHEATTVEVTVAFAGVFGI